MAISESGHWRSAAENELSALRARISARLHNRELPPQWAGVLTDLRQTIDSTPVGSLSDEALASLIREAGKALEDTSQRALFMWETERAAESSSNTISRSEEPASGTRTIEAPGRAVEGL